MVMANSGSADGENNEMSIKKPSAEKKVVHSELLLPISRVRTIMKSSPDVENISQDALYAITAATEMFIRDLSDNVLKSKTGDLKQMRYGDLASFINSQEHYKGFLEEIIPLKISGHEILADHAKKNSTDDDEKSNGTDEGGDDDNDDEDDEDEST